jgi:hypothetical protein
MNDGLRALIAGTMALLEPFPQVGRTQVGGFVVSTVLTPDEGYETAVMDVAGTHPVERYVGEPAAKEGHARWVEKIKSGEAIVTELPYGAIPAAVVVLEPMSAADAGRVKTFREEST